MRDERTAGLDWHYTVMRSLCGCFALPVFLSFLFCFFSCWLVCVLLFRLYFVLARLHSTAEIGKPLPLHFAEKPSTMRKIVGEVFWESDVVGLWGKRVVQRRYFRDHMCFCVV